MQRYFIFASRCLLSQFVCGVIAASFVANAQRVYSPGSTPQNTITNNDALPNIDFLLSEAQKNQKAIDEIRENYTFTKVEEEMDLDKQGQIKNRREREYVVFFVNGHEIQKLVRKDGKDLPPPEQQKEEEKARREVIKHMGGGTKNAASSRREEEDEDELHISTFLRAARFTHPRKESFHSQAVIAFDIEPNPWYHAQNLNERLVQRLEGTMWIDERAHQVVRLEAHLSATAKIGGGLLGTVQKGSAAVFEQALVNNEVWLPSYLEEHLSGRVLLFKGYREDFVIRYKEYKKFRVDVNVREAVKNPN